MKSRSFWTGVAVLAAGLIFVTGGGATTTATVTLTVNSSADDATPCTIVSHKSTGTCTLRGAILAAGAYGHDNTMFVIKLAATTYHLSLGTLDVDAATANTANIVEIVGVTVGKKHVAGSIINGSGNPKPSSVFIIDSPTQMFNVVITGGTGNANYSCYSSNGGCGGGVFLNSALDLENSVVRNNTACSAYTGNACTGTYVLGGGIYDPYGAPPHDLLTLYKTTVTHNVAYEGGGIYNEGHPATVLILSSHINKNTACGTFSNGVCIGYGAGGGLYNDGEQVVFDHSTVNGNIAGSPAYNTGDGGGIYQDNDNMQLNHTTVSGNVAGYEGGGIAVGDDNIDIVGSTISHNAAGAYGGGVYLDWLASFTNTTLSSNTAGGTFECTINGNYTTCQHSIKMKTGTCATLYPSATSCEAEDGYGGGLYSDSEYPQFIASRVENNLAASISGDAVDCGGGDGGGIYTSWTLTAVQGTLVAKNVADCGGGIYNDSDTSYPYTLALADSAVVANTAIEDGGGIWTKGSGTLTLYGMVIAFNHAGRQTGGVWDDELGSVLLGGLNKIVGNASPGACPDITLPCR